MMMRIVGAERMGSTARATIERGHMAGRDPLVDLMIDVVAQGLICGMIVGESGLEVTVLMGTVGQDMSATGGSRNDE
jgi:hypothetical protein